MLMLYICDLAKKAGFRVIDVFVGSTSLLSSSRGVLLYTIYRMEEICGVPHRYLGETDSSIYSKKLIDWYWERIKERIERSKGAWKNKRKHLYYSK